MEQFSLEKYLANPSRKVVTKDGHPVRILCTDRKSYNVEIVGLIMNDNGMESIFTWTQQGKEYINSDTSNDLFFAPEKHEGWVNIFKSSNDIAFLGHSLIFKSKEDAEKNGKDCKCYSATVKVEWEE